MTWVYLLKDPQGRKIKRGRSQTRERAYRVALEWIAKTRGNTAVVALLRTPDEKEA